MALGTVADIAPLIGENRSLAHFGLGGLKESKLVGLRALIASAGLTGQKLDSFHVGFLLAPRLNACGRMGHARLAVEIDGNGMKIPRDPSCPLCGDNPTIHELIDYEAFCGAPVTTLG